MKPDRKRTLNEKARERRPLALIAVGLAFLLVFTGSLAADDEGTARATKAVKSVGGTWVAQGPGPNTLGQVEGIVDGEVVGAINSVAPHPTDANILYAGAVNGGIWRTNNATATNPNWIQQTDAKSSISINTVDFDPADATHQTLIAAIGRFSSFGRVGGARTGVLHTTNGGASWTEINGSGTLTGSNLSGVAARGATFVVSANDSDLGSPVGTGIYRSTDTGATWTQISVGNGAATGLPAGVSFDLVGDRVNTTRLFTSMLEANLSGGTNGVYRSTNTGATWSKVSSPAMDSLLVTGTTVNVEFAISAANNVVYCGIVNGGTLAGVFRSADGGTTWTAMDLPTDGAIGIHPGGQGSIHFSMAADPTNANLLYIGGDRQGFPNNVGAFDFSGRLFRGDASQAPGSQWVHLTHSSAVGPAGGGTANTSAPHADSRDMNVDAAGTLIEGDDGGIYKRTSPQDNTGDWLSIIGDLQTAEFHNAAYDANADIVMAGAQDTGSSAQVMSNGARWASISTADGGDVAVDDSTTPGFSTRYSSFQFLGAFQRQVWNAANVFQSSSGIALTVLGGGPGVSAQFYTPIKLNETDQTRLLIGAANGVYESFDQGDTVTQLSPAIAVNGTFSQPLAYGVPSNANIIYVGSGSDVYIRTGAPPAALVLSGAYPGALTVRDIVIDPDSAATAFVADTTSVYRTTTTGAAWTNITGDLPTFAPGDLRSINYIPDPGDDAVVVGATTGVFVAFESDGFVIWQKLGTDLPTAPVFDLDYDAASNLLVAGTLGRGAWKLGEPLSVPEEIFDDAFESGNTSAWSSSVQ